MFALITHVNNDFWYGVVLLLHLIAVIAGLGPTFAYPIFGSVAKQRGGSEGEAISRATLDVAGRLEFAVFAIPVFGLLLVFMSDDAISLGDGWIIAGIVLYAIALYISLGLHTPNLRRMNDLQRELVAMGPPPAGAAPSGPPPQVAELEERGKRAGMYGGILHLLLLLLLIDMIWKPGWP